MDKNRIPYIEFLPIILIGLIFFKLLDRIDSLYAFAIGLLAMFQPVFWAIGISYALNPMMKFFQKKLRLKRIFSILLCYVIVLGVITALITIVIPMIVNNVSDLVSNFDTFREQGINYFNDVIATSNLFEELSLEEYLNIEVISQYFGDIPVILNSTVDAIVTMLLLFFGGLFKIIIGFVIAVYLLLDKEKFQVGSKRIMFSYMKLDTANKTVLFLMDVNKIFSRYIIGKTIDSAIIGIMCYIGLVILNVRYAALLAIIVGITNMIPYFGPFIGMVPAIIITVFFSPIKALWVALFIFGLQQFDGYYLGPKILGDSVGLSPFWIILGILVGGSLFGVLGMLVAVPIVAVIQLIAIRAINKKLTEKDIIID